MMMDGPSAAMDLGRELEECRSLLAALVLVHGEELGNDRYRGYLTREALEIVDGMQLRVILEPNSGAVLLRLGPPTA